MLCCGASDGAQESNSGTAFSLRNRLRIHRCSRRAFVRLAGRFADPGACGTSMPLATINAVWIGPRLGPVHVACLRSFLRHGHRTILHVYEKPLDAPEGMDFMDANDLLPASQIIRYTRGGSLAIFSNLLRYEILRRGFGLYVDCDVFCLRPVEDADYIFGFESSHSIGSSVLKLPRDCPALDCLCAIK